MTKLLTRLLFKLLDGHIVQKYDMIEVKKMERWLLSGYEDSGWKSYFAKEDIKLLKSMATGLDREKYWMMIGRRLQLLYLYNDMKQVFDNKKKEYASEKGKVESDS